MTYRYTGGARYVNRIYIVDVLVFELLARKTLHAASPLAQPWKTYVAREGRAERG